MPRARKTATASRKASTRSTKTSRARGGSTTAKAETFTCPECGRTFTRAAAMGAHRRQAHGVAGTSTQARSRKTRASASRLDAPKRRQRKTASSARSGSSTGSNGAVNRDALLRGLFPNGIPAKESVIRSVNSWLDEAERLARLR
jgi:predicted RNA-binding Zn-ribbon protein involved in translation (DUF1610 family)